jgi:hypothetical protein
MVGILPPRLNHKDFGNVASLRGHDYFSADTESPNSAHSGDWQSVDVDLIIERLMDVGNIANKAMYNKACEVVMFEHITFAPGGFFLLGLSCFEPFIFYFLTKWNTKNIK